MWRGNATIAMAKGVGGRTRALSRPAVDEHCGGELGGCLREIQTGLYGLIAFGRVLRWLKELVRQTAEDRRRSLLLLLFAQR